MKAMFFLEFFTANIIHWITNLKIFDHHKKFAELIQNAYQEMITNMENAYKIDAFFKQILKYLHCTIQNKRFKERQGYKKKSKSYS